MPVQVPRLVPGRLLQLELERVAANTSRLMGRRVVPPPVDGAQLCGGEAHVAALLSWVQVSSGCSPARRRNKACQWLSFHVMHVVVPAGSDWCGLRSVQAVCRLYNVDVTDFSTSFADGRVLCLLVRGLTREQLLWR